MNDPVITDWYFIRHAPVVGGKSGLYQSANEPADLSDSHRLKSLAAILPDEADWFTSPLIRTETTANALYSYKNDKSSIIQDPRLIEQDFGGWFGLSSDDLWAKISHLKGHNWAWLDAETKPEGGESFMDVWERAKNFMDTVSATSNNRPKVIVSHAGVIRAFISHALGLKPDVALSLGINTLSLTHMQHTTGVRNGGAWRLVCQNT
jgi:alpha-ribazole phosphatase